MLSTRIDEARVQYLVKLRAKPGDINLRKRYIEFLKKHGYFDAEFNQLKVLTRCLQPHDKHMARVYNRMAIIAHRDQNKFKEAIFYANKAIETDDQYAAAYSTLAKLCNDGKYARQLYSTANHLNLNRLRRHDVNLYETAQLCDNKKIQVETQTLGSPKVTTTSPIPVTAPTPVVAPIPHLAARPASAPFTTRAQKRTKTQVVTDISTTTHVQRMTTHPNFYARKPISPAKPKTECKEPHQLRGAISVARAHEKSIPAKVAKKAEEQAAKPKQQQPRIEEQNAYVLEGVWNAASSVLICLYGMFSCCRSKPNKQELGAKKLVIKPR